MAVYNLTLVLADGSFPEDGSDPLAPDGTDISLPKWDDGTINFALVNAAGDAVDATGGAFLLAVRKHPSDVTPLVSREATAIDFATGTGYFPIGSYDTGIDIGGYSYDLNITDVSGTTADVIVGVQTSRSWA